ncbi:MAG: transglycosylase SLT domain-containing protein [Deltaproteobacteria bacterium]|nr:transglycosylase SLT domain-containing protein [Deltaproteobacteria bacterium]
MGSAHRPRYARLLVLSFILLSPLSCYQEGLRAQPQPDQPAGVTPADPWAAYRPLLEGDTLAKQREIFHLGYRFLQEKNHDGARLFLSRALEVYSSLADYSLCYLGILHREDGQAAEAQASFLRLLAEYPDSIWAGRATLELATLALAESNWAEAAQYAEQARASRVALAPVRHEAALVLAQAREGQGDVADAYSLYQELRRTAPRSAAGKKAKEGVERLRTLEPDRFALRDDQQYLDEVRLLAQEANGEKMEELAQQFSTRFPTSPLRPEVLTVLAAAYKRQARIEDAIAIWKEVTESDPRSAVAPVALYEWATVLWNKDRDDEAHAVFERLTQRYPRHSQAAEAWYAIGRIWQESNEDKRAAKAYQRLAALFPDSPLAREGRWRQGWMVYRRGEFRQAEKLFAALAKSAQGTPEGESALYWQARAIERRAAAEKARNVYRDLLRRYPDGYYAVWAEKRLHVTPPPLEPGTDGVATLPSLPPRLDGHYHRSQELHAIGLLALARRELDVVKEDAPREPAFIRFLLAEYSRLEGYAAALRFAQSLAREGNGNWLRYLFPHAYWETVSAQAREKQLDPYLVLALIRQESLFDPEAVSSAQAYGLMQLLPSTAARLTHSPSVSPVSLTNPGFNVEAGTAYLRHLLDLYDGNMMMAVAAYNAGENAVEKWRMRYAKLEPDEFVESISFRETRNYVKLVLRNYRTYRRLYGGGESTNEEVKVKS